MYFKQVIFKFPSKIGQTDKLLKSEFFEKISRTCQKFFKSIFVICLSILYTG